MTFILKTLGIVKSYDSFYRYLQSLCHSNHAKRQSWSQKNFKKNLPHPHDWLCLRILQINCWPKWERTRHQQMQIQQSWKEKRALGQMQLFLKQQWIRLLVNAPKHSSQRGTQATGFCWNEGFNQNHRRAHAGSIASGTDNGAKMGSYAYRRRDTWLIRTIKWFFPAMKLDSANAHPMGSLIHDGIHTPFHALACPLNPRMVRIGKKR